MATMAWSLLLFEETIVPFVRWWRAGREEGQSGPSPRRRSLSHYSLIRGKASEIAVATDGPWRASRLRVCNPGCLKTFSSKHRITSHSSRSHRLHGGPYLTTLSLRASRAAFDTTCLLLLTPRWFRERTIVIKTVPRRTVLSRCRQATTREHLCWQQPRTTMTIQKYRPSLLYLKGLSFPSFCRVLVSRGDLLPSTFSKCIPSDRRPSYHMNSSLHSDMWTTNLNGVQRSLSL